MNTNLTTNTDLAGTRIPDSKLAREITELVRDTESPLLFHHSSRVYYWGALGGKRRGLRFDPELLYAGAMFHDMGLTHQHSTTQERFEVDSANTARDFLRSHGVHQQDVETVWTAIALHTTPGIPPHMHPVVALVTAGVEMDVLGLAYSEYSDAEREAVVHAHPRSARFKEDIIQAFYDGNKHKLKDRRSGRPGAAPGYLADREDRAFRPGGNPGAAHARQGLGRPRHLHRHARHHPLHQGQDLFQDRQADADVRALLDRRG